MANVSTATGVTATITPNARFLLDPKPSEKYAPKQLYDILMGLDVPTPTGGAVRVKITKYLNTSSTPGKDANGGPGFAALWHKLGTFAKRSADSYILPVAIDSAAQMMSAGMDFSIDRWELWRFFCGKASPQEIRRALFTAQVAGLVQSSQTALQNYCDQQGGMDCSGFASVSYGYFRDAGHAGPDASAYRTRGVERKTIDEIRAGDAIVWLQENHIAVIDNVMGPFQMSPPLRCKVAESTAGIITAAGPGVQYSEYAFERDTNSTTRKYICLRPKLSGGYTQLSATKITVRGNA